MTVAPSREETASFAHATSTPFPAVVSELQQMFGGRLVAYLAGVTEARRLKDWINGSRDPRGDVEDRLRLALHVARMIADREGPAVARAWFVGINPYLNDNSAAWLMREEDLNDVGKQIVAAARAFLSQ